MSRSKWKSNFLDNFLKNEKFYTKKKKYVWSRRSVIPENLINQIVFVYNGKEFNKVYITREKVGFKFGDFSMTRRFTKKKKKHGTKR